MKRFQDRFIIVQLRERGAQSHQESIVDPRMTDIVADG